MPDQKNISSDTARSMLQHFMFGVLFVLIILNWRVHKPMDYAVFNQGFSVISKEADLYKLYQSERIKNIFFEEDTIRSYPYLKLQADINLICENEILDIQSLKQTFADSIFPIRKRNLLFEVALNNIDHVRDTLMKFAGINENSEFARQLMINKGEIQFCRDVIHRTFSPLDYNTNTVFIALLNSLQNKIENTRALFLDLLIDKVHETSLGPCGGFHAIAVPEVGFYIPGQTVKSIIGIVEYGSVLSKKHSILKFSEGQIDHIEEGIFYWSDKCTELGVNTIFGNINANKSVKDIVEPFTFSYFVSAPGVAFHLDKANVCYIGVPNTVSINIPGYTADRIKLRVAGATVSKVAEGQFEILFSKMPAGKVYAYVDATNAQGRTSTVHSMELKLKPLPAPLTHLEQYKENGIALADFKTIKSLQLFAVDSAFAMDYTVVSFQVECIHANHQYTEAIEVKGADFESNAELQKLFASAQVGDRFICSHIIAKGTNGLRYEVLPVSVAIK